ncbi:type I polyketide synthase [Laceyella putida]|uniref:Beta-ketoacyl synthase N-terminal-like domain-containing protein n=1 Tax=Laceyella putida TaxID=110101 RepID=A0ABW2RHZ1_9BACL
MSQMDYTGLEIAIVGMDGRFPGAKNVHEFWKNLKQGRDTISRFTREELLAQGISEEELDQPNYVPAKGMLEEIDRFDAEFFEMLPKEAEWLDPQVRLFLETAWKALEDAGYVGERYPGAIGVYAGAALNTYLFQIVSSPKALPGLDDFQLMLGNDKDLLSLRTAYKLNLKGPAVTIQTTCSTSLVAVHLACQALLSGECDMALAGGVSLLLPQKKGYVYQEGMIYSPDGTCRPFDAEAGGTVFGDGVGAVVLKRLEDALDAGDHIYAVIKGSAVNNDGTDKVGLTAPSVSGQASVIKAALAMAEVDPETVSYVEAHGTGTPLGDPIELRALTEAFREKTGEKQFCAIGSVKSNVGHLNTAAGVAGLIKTALALKHQQIPPSLHVERPNPNIDFENSPFYVQTQLTPWQRRKNAPRRAGISSFGIGGTNAHLVLEEAPVRETEPTQRSFHLLTLSAKTPAALEQATDQLAEHLGKETSLSLADVAQTLRIGRLDMHHRRFVVAADAEDAKRALVDRNPKRVFTAETSPNRPVVFLFPGQGSQYVNMAKGWYEREEVFRQEVDRCAEFLKPHLERDLRELLYPVAGTEEEAAEALGQTRYTQPALFVVEYALAKQWMAWGIEPEAMLGHSVGEYVAATLSGVIKLEDALALVAMRGRLIQGLPSGEMLVVRATEEQVLPLLNEDVSLAAVNAPGACVVSGSVGAVARLEQTLQEAGIMSRRLRTSHAFHSHMMEPAMEPYTERLRQCALNPPNIPFLSNVTGTWIKAEEATEPTYWARHLREAVRFADGMAELLKKPERIYLEVGPGRTLATLAKQQGPAGKRVMAIACTRHPQEAVEDETVRLEALGRLWLAGVTWSDGALYGKEKRARVPLPTYPFSGKRYWVEGAWHSVYSIRHSLPESPKRTAKREEVDVGPTHAPAMTATGPRNELEAILAEVLSEVMGISEVSVFDDFFELGGNSLVASQAVARMREVLQLELPVQVLFEKRTISELAEEIESRLVAELDQLSDEEVERLMERS